MSPSTTNQLFSQWLKEWWTEHAAKQGSEKLASVYKRAYNSMNQHPDILTSGSEAVKVAFIGKGIAAKLQKRWEEHLACVSRGPQGTASASSDGTLPGNGPEKGPLFLDLCAPVQSRPLKTMNRPLDGDSTLPSASQYRPRKARSKQYVPSYRSGAFAILLALHRNAPHDGETLTKAQLVQLGQGLCDASFTVPDRSKRTQGPSGAQYAYTAWNSMKSLLQKDLVHREGHPNHRYSLTDEGRDIARKLEVGLHGEIVPLNDSAVVELPASQSTHQPVDSPARSIPPVTESLNDLPFVRFSSRSFEVILLLDAREVLDRGDRSLFAVGLEKEGIRVETRSLELGDAVWIARDDSGVEIVLDCLVERKTMADLVASIKDGRFNEQGFRQRRCGLRNVVYLVENTHMQTARNFGWDAIQTSLVLVQIRDGFFLKRVGSGQDSIEYLARMTRSIERIYQDRELFALTRMDKARVKEFQETTKLLTYDAFKRLNTKTKSNTVKDIWGKQLLTIRGMSLEKASLISEHFPTCSLFVERFSNMDSVAREAELVGLGNPLSRRGIKASLAKKISEVFFGASCGA